ncbi:hypothetical protein CSQ96_07970 [Janthinobacterium sp. BJB412]|nr:hypothetical protein CSQ96_07970 [Janthinobacterium sp. BJB412]
MAVKRDHAWIGVLRFKARSLLYDAEESGVASSCMCSMFSVNCRILSLLRNFTMFVLMLRTYINETADTASPMMEAHEL